MLKFFKFYVLAIILLVASACGEDEMPDPGPTEPDYATGVFVVCEGPFQNGTGTIHHYNRETKELTSNLFQAQNDGLPLGNIVQSMAPSWDDSYIITINNDNKLIKVNQSTFEVIETFEGFELPRYTSNNSLTDIGFVTQWGADGLSGSLQKIDYKDGSKESLSLGQGPEQILLSGDFLYIPNVGGFGRDSVVQVVSTNPFSLVATIVVGDNPNGIQKDVNTNFWVLCTGYSDWMEPLNNTPGKLVKISSTNEIIESFEVPNGAADLVISKDGTRLFFSANGQVLSHSIFEPEFLGAVWIDKSFYSLGVDPETGNLFGGDAKDFTSNGEVSVYDDAGTLLESFEAGVIPGNFLFR